MRITEIDRSDAYAREARRIAGGERTTTIHTRKEALQS
jgi:hypothetical protein